MKNPKTTIAGICAAVAAILVAVSFMLDGDPKTNPDWAGVVNTLTAAGVAIFGGGVAALGLAAADGRRTEN